MSTRGTPKTHPHESPKAKSRDSPKTKPRDSPKNKPRDSPKNKPRDSPKNKPRDSPKAKLPPGSNREWTRIGPMGCLIDPKVIPMNCKASCAQVPHCDVTNLSAACCPEVCCPDFYFQPVCCQPCYNPLERIHPVTRPKTPKWFRPKCLPMKWITEYQATICHIGKIIMKERLHCHTNRCRSKCQHILSTEKLKRYKLESPCRKYIKL